MQCNYLQLITCILISVYLSKTNVSAFVVKDRDNSDGAANQQEENINLNSPSFAKFKCPAKIGAYPDVEDCGKFYLCIFGFSRRMPCPPFHHFDMHRRRCMSVVVAVCDNGEDLKETTPPDDKGSTEEDQEFVCPEISGTFPHSTDCSKYYTCESFVPSLKTCPELKLFDGIEKECRPESEVNCGSRDIPTKSTSSEDITTPEEPTPTTPEVDEQTAPETGCDEDDLDCIITETGEIPKWFKCPVELGSYRHPLSKKLFIFCINKKPLVKRCGQDLVYSKELVTCVPPEYPEEQTLE